jgi:phage tail protein X
MYLSNDGLLIEGQVVESRLELALPEMVVNHSMTVQRVVEMTSPHNPI